MMRSLFSAVSGLKTHQTRMDVIGNNIANVNTEAFKASSVRFSELMYQTMSTASGGDASTGTGGVNAKQVGLGVSTASTMINITGAGSSETTGYPFDLKLSDSQTTNFFIVSDGTNTMFTRAGSFYVDGNGYLCMSSTGYTVQGWQVDKTTGEIHKDTVSPLQVMSPSNTTSAPEATTEQAAPAQEPAAEEAADPKDDKKKDGGWFNKKAREMEAVKAKLDAAEQNAAQAKEQLLRMAAEYDNYRKRSTREADQKFGDGVSHAVEKIIPILDTLNMAANAPTTDENYKKGVVMTLDKAAKALEALHVEEIEVLGKPFDPNFMNAVQQIPAPDGQESGTVVTVFQKGYKLGDKIIRHATVVVAE